MRAERFGSLFWLAVGLISIYGSSLLGLGTLREPGPGLFPFFAGCFVSLMAIVAYFQSFLREWEIQDKLSALWKGLNWHRPLAISLLSLGYILALERIGFLLASFLLLFTLFKGVEKFSWKKSILIPVVTLGTIFLLINFLLKGTLPKGVLGF